MSFRAMMRRNGFSIRLPDVYKAKVTRESFRPGAGAARRLDRLRSTGIPWIESARH